MIMKKSYHIHLYIILAMLTALTACRQDEIAVNDGKFNITLTDAPTHPTRSLPFALDEELVKSFRLHIKDKNGINYYNGTLEQYNAGAAPALRPDEYLLQADYGDNPVVALDAPYYISEQTPATVTAHTTTDVELVCRVGNSLATFAFANPDAAATTFESYEFITMAGGQSVSCTADDGKNPYFKAGTTVEFYLKGTTRDGSNVDYKFATIAAAEKQKNYKYTLSLGEGPQGNGTLDITVDTSVETVSISETVPPAWLPKPQLGNDGFDASNNLYYRETTDAVTARINYHAFMPVEDIEFELDFNDPNLYVLNKTYKMSEMTEEERNTLAEAGIILPELHTETGAIDFTQMTGRLLSMKSGADARNTINVRVYANQRWSTQTKYVIYAQCPEFSITVNENDFWSKEFSVRALNVASGNAERIKENMVFQYTEDGINWIDCNTGMAQKFASVPERKEYQVRALYRGSITSNVEGVVLETPAQMPNSGMEDWYYVQLHKKGFLSTNTYTVYPWTENGSSFWETNNDFTTRNRGTFSNIYNCFPAVSFVKDAHSGTWAAELRNTGNGRGNTTPSNVLDMNKVAGELFTGNINVTTGGSDASPSGDNYTITPGRDFSVRPTALRFYHKYVPYGTDTWRASIELLDGNGNSIISQTYESSEASNTWTPVTVTLNYTDGTDYAKCKSIFVKFSSTVNPGKNMQYKKGNYSIYLDNRNSPSSFDNVWWGSILTIDDIELIYDK